MRASQITSYIAAIVLGIFIGAYFSKPKSADVPKTDGPNQGPIQLLNADGITFVPSSTPPNNVPIKILNADKIRFVGESTDSNQPKPIMLPSPTLEFVRECPNAIIVDSCISDSEQVYLIKAVKLNPAPHRRWYMVAGWQKLILSKGCSSLGMTTDTVNFCNHHEKTF